MFTYCHELWLVMESRRSQIQTADLSFLCRVAVFSLSGTILLYLHEKCKKRKLGTVISQERLAYQNY